MSTDEGRLIAAAGLTGGGKIRAGIDTRAALVGLETDIATAALPWAGAADTAAEGGCRATAFLANADVSIGAAFAIATLVGRRAAFIAANGATGGAAATLRGAGATGAALTGRTAE